MRIIECGNCHAKNRVPSFRLSARPTCGKCGAFLPEPRALTVARDIRRILRTYWFLVAGLVLMWAAYFLIPLFNPPKPVSAPLDFTSQSTPVAQVASNPAPPPAPPARDPFVVDVPPIKLSPIVPVVTCNPKRQRSGAQKLYGKGPSDVPLKIITPIGENYVFTLSPVGTDQVRLKAFIVGGDTKVFKVPPGNYEIYAETGSTWCGFDAEFGDEGASAVQLSDTFEFTRTLVPGGVDYAGQRIDVTPQLMGNLRSEKVAMPKLRPAGPEQSDGGENE